MSKRVGAIIDDDLYRRVKTVASQEGVTVSSFIEQALVQHLGSREVAASRSLGDSTWGIISIDKETFEAVMLEPGYLDS